MSQIIVFSSDAGGVSVCIPTGELSIEAVKEKDTPKGSIIMDSADLPPHNDFFDAFELIDGKVEVSFPKAVELTKKRLRAERATLLAAQDVAFQRALEEGKDTAAIIAEKQRLRDITNITATTLDELRALKAEV
jgi:hypothetical protein